MCDAGTDLCEAWTEHWRVARKQHWCLACHETIAQGERYHVGSGVFDHRGFTVKHCARCWAMFRAISHDNPGQAIDFDLNCGEIWESPPEDVAALAFALPRDFAEAAAT